MLFNSLEYLLFLPIVFIIYWLIGEKSLKLQNAFLLIVSYIFYAWWDWRFLFLLIFSTLLDFYTGIKVSESQNPKIRKGWFLASIIINLGFLGVFKYYNFFVQSFAESLNALGITIDTWTLNIILPVGISFYTFHGLSYVIDIYKKRISSEKNFIDYAVFVCYFPLLVAGPIERATHLLPQIKKKREFSYPKAISALRVILWGMFKKVVIADSIAMSVNDIYTNYDSYPSEFLVLGAFLFSIQIYCDFSGYSDIAIGSSRLLGMELLRNFNFPYFSRSVAEFWRRWHISLSTWFRDYVYVPLGGSRVTKIISIRNVFIIFLISGFWHGANWTFIMWGGLHAVLFIPSFISGNNKKLFTNYNLGIPNAENLKDLILICITFVLICITWIFFRSENIEQAFIYIQNMISKGFTGSKYINPYDHQPLYFEYTMIGLMFIVEFFMIHKLNPLTNKIIRRISYMVIIFIIITSIHLRSPTEFIYFQF